MAERFSYQLNMNDAVVDRTVSVAVNCDLWFSFQSLTGHTTPIESLQINMNEKLIVAGSQSGSIRVWDLEAAKSMFPWVFISVNACFLEYNYA